MNEEKQLYETPTVQTFAVRFEGIICQSTGSTSINDWQNGDDFPIGF